MSTLELMSALGFGASPLGGVFGEVDEEDACAAVVEAIDRGVTFFDVSPYYGDTRAERVLGRALRGVDRSRYALCTKVGRYGESAFDFSRERVRRSLDESMERLGVERFDVVLCHDIEFAPMREVLNGALPVLAEMKGQGVIGKIGVSGYPLEVLREAMTRADLDVALSYGHYTLHDTTLTELVDVANTHDVTLINASPLSMGLLTQQGPPPWHPAGAELREAARCAAAYCEANGLDLAHVALQWSKGAPGVATTLVGVSSRDELGRNLATWNAPPVAPNHLDAITRIFDGVRDRGW